MTAYAFLGIPVPGDAARLADRLVLRDLRDGALIVRMRTERAVPLRCRCGHLERFHGADRKGRPMCFATAVCGCAAWTPTQEKTP